jgi:hypothetical protein
MRRAPRRTNFNSSRLIRTLAELELVGAPEAQTAFAEKFGQWVDFVSANTLSSALNAISASPNGGNFSSQPVAATSLAQDFARTRINLANSITKSCAQQVANTRMEQSSVKPGKPFDIAGAYMPYRRNHLAHQRDMDLSIRPLRSNVRDALARSSPALRKLAVLDATFENILLDRESKLLSTLASLLEKRFTRLFKAHQQALVDAQQADHPEQWMEPGAWLARFCAEHQSVLLAELDLRLQPVVGLIETFNNENIKQP